MKFNIKGKVDAYSNGKMAINIVFFPEEANDEISITLEGRSLLEICQEMVRMLMEDYDKSYEDALIFANVFLSPFGLKYLELLDLQERQKKLRRRMQSPFAYL